MGSKSNWRDPSEPYQDGSAVVVSTPFPACRGFHVATAGSYTLVTAGGTTLTMTLAVGYQPLSITNVTAAAGAVTALY